MSKRRLITKERFIATAGTKLLASAIKEKSARVVRNLNAQVYLDNSKGSQELKLYQFIMNHISEYNVMPTASIVAEHLGFSLPQVNQPSSYYFRRVKERALVNSIGEPCNRLLNGIRDPKQNMESIESSIDELYQAKMRLINHGTGIESSHDLIDEVSYLFNERKSSMGQLSGITTGWDEIDAVLDGYQNGDLVVWVGRPGRSKSWMLLKQCYSAWMAGYRPLYVSMEMSGVQNMRRMIGLHSRINPTFMRKGTIGTFSMPVFDSALQELRGENMLHMVTANFTRTVDQIASFVEEYKPEILYIDAGYLLSPRKKRYGSSGRRETISDVIEELKELSVNANIPTIITVQFNRNAEQRRRSADNKRHERNEVSDPIAHLSLAEIGETDVIGQVGTHVFGIDYPPYPLPKNAFRVFGLLKAREGESGWWLVNHPATNTSPIDFSLVPRDAEAYRILHTSSVRTNSNPRLSSATERANMMDIQ